MSDERLLTICKLIQKVGAWYFPRHIYSYLTKGMHYELPGVFSRKAATLIESIHISLEGRAALDGGRHFLKFYDGSNVFYLIIHYCPIAIYIPGERIFIRLYKIYNTTPEELVRKLEELEPPRKLTTGAYN